MVGCGVGVHASDVNGSGVSTSGQSSVIVQVLVLVASAVQADHVVHSHASVVQGGAQDCAIGGIGSSAFGQSKRIWQERVCISPAQVDQKAQCQVSLTHSLSARVRVVCAATGITPAMRPMVTATKNLRYTKVAIGNILAHCRRAAHVLHMSSSYRSVRISPGKILQFQRRLLTWYRRHGEDFIWRKNPTPYRVLVAEVMLQQTQVSRVESKYRQFLRRYPNVRALAQARTRDLLQLWSGLGYNRRAIALRECARKILCHHGGRIPKDHAALCRLPGIGPYTAAAVNVFARNRDEVCIDTNVRRVLIHEFHLPHDLDRRTLESVARQTLPAGRSRVWHSALMDYGRTVATSRRTKIRSSGKKSETFVGSRRYYRGRLLKLLVSRRQLTAVSIASLLELPLAKTKNILQRMEHDGLIARRGRNFALPR